MRYWNAFIAGLINFMAKTVKSQLSVILEAVLYALSRKFPDALNQVSLFKIRKAK